MAGRPETQPRPQRAARHLTLADELTPTCATVDPAELVEALEDLEHEGPLDLYVRAGAVELTACVAGGAVWETVLADADVSQADDGAQRRTTIERRSLVGALHGAGGDATEIRIAPNGAMTVGGVVLTPVRGALREPPRPNATGVLRERLSLPRSAAGIEMILRLEGPNVCVPEAVRQRFGRRRVSSVSLFEEAGEWFISGVRNGNPTMIVVGAVGVY